MIILWKLSEGKAFDLVKVDWKISGVKFKTESFYTSYWNCIDDLKFLVFAKWFLVNSTVDWGIIALFFYGLSVST